LNEVRALNLEHIFALITQHSGVKYITIWAGQPAAGAVAQRQQLIKCS
jgi:hypothetical protein